MTASAGVIVGAAAGERSALQAVVWEPGGAARFLDPLPAGRLCISVCEGFRGPVVQAIETDADGRLLHCKVQDASMINWFGLALAVRENEISDFPICNKSFDLSYCGNDL